MNCSACGATNDQGRDTCQACGEPLSVTNPPAVLIRRGEGTSHVIRDQVLVGRLAGTDVTVPDKSVSREHARVTLRPDGYEVEDLGSTNGTLVNGRRIMRSTALNSGDIITFGSVEFLFEQQKPAVVSVSPASESQVDDLYKEDEDESAFPFYSATESATSAASTQVDEPVEAVAAQPVVIERGVGELTGADQAGSSTLDDIVAAAEHLAHLARALSGDARMSGEQARELETLRGSLASVRASLTHVPASPREDEIRTMKESLDSLRSSPRDIEVLLEVGRHADRLVTALETLEQMESIIQRVADAVGMERIA